MNYFNRVLLRCAAFTACTGVLCQLAIGEAQQGSVLAAICFGLCLTAFMAGAGLTFVMLVSELVVWMVPGDEDNQKRKRGAAAEANQKPKRGE
jgi:hypothetical protein